MPTPRSELRTVMDRLPFPVDETDAVNEAFRNWVQNQDPEAGRIVDLWTYCYICRYFLAKSMRNEFCSVSDIDELISRSYRKVRSNLDDVRAADRFASWVSVVCKNTFLNYARRDRYSESIDGEEAPKLHAEVSRPVANIGFVREAFEKAIEQLPTYLREPARLYFLENREFEEISEAIGKPVPTVRTYKHKAAEYLRKDETLREYVDRPDL